jgi:hypothetical protein
LQWRIKCLFSRSDNADPEPLAAGQVKICEANSSTERLPGAPLLFVHA